MKRILDRYCRLLKVIMTLMIGFILVPVSMQILSRYTGLVPRYIWTEEIARFCFVWIIMIGSMIAVREGTHFHVDLMPAPKTTRERGSADLIVHGFMMLMSLVFAWYGTEFAMFGAGQRSEMSGINLALIYVSFPLAGFSWVLFLVERIIDDIRRIAATDAGEDSTGESP